MILLLGNRTGSLGYLARNTLSLALKDLSTPQEWQMT